MGSSPTRGSSFFLGNVTTLGVLCCFALFVCLTLLASFFLPSHLSLVLIYIKLVIIYNAQYLYVCTFTCCGIASIVTGMGPEESGVPDNSWVPADDNPDVTSPYLPPISGKGKVRLQYYSSAEITFKAAALTAQ